LQYGAEASYNNLGGMGRQISFRGSISEERQQAAIGPRTLLGRKVGVGYLEPHLFDYPLDGTIGVNHSAQAVLDYWQLSHAGEVALSHKLRALFPGSKVAVFYGQKIAREEGAPETEDELITGEVRIGRIGVRYNLDRRDNLKFPTTGYVLDTELSWARYELGGNLRYFRWHISNSHYFGIIQDWVIALGYRLTSYEGIERKGESRDLDILPPSERLFAGGSNSIRGFDERELGPIVRSPNFEQFQDGKGWDCSYKKSELGGSRRTILKAELRYKILDEFATSLFVDNGNTFFSKKEKVKS